MDHGRRRGHGPRPRVGPGIASSTISLDVFVPIPLNGFARGLLDDRTYATVATINADGSSQTSVVWVKRQGDLILFSTSTGRLEARKIARDPRVSVTLFALDAPCHTVEIRGTAEPLPGPDRALPRELPMKYRGGDPPPEPAGVERVTVSISAQRLIEFPPS